MSWILSEAAAHCKNIPQSFKYMRLRKCLDKTSEYLKFKWHKCHVVYVAKKKKKEYLLITLFFNSYWKFQSQKSVYSIGFVYGIKTRQRSQECTLKPTNGYKDDCGSSSAS